MQLTTFLHLCVKQSAYLQDDLQVCLGDVVFRHSVKNLHCAVSIIEVVQDEVLPVGEDDLAENLGFNVSEDVEHANSFIAVPLLEECREQHHPVVVVVHVVLVSALIFDDLGQLFKLQRVVIVGGDPRRKDLQHYRKEFRVKLQMERRQRNDHVDHCVLPIDRQLARIMTIPNVHRLLQSTLFSRLDDLLVDVLANQLHQCLTFAAIGIVHRIEMALDESAVETIMRAIRTHHQDSLNCSLIDLSSTV
jgi:hypothetical protein